MRSKLSPNEGVLFQVLPKPFFLFPGLCVWVGRVFEALRSAGAMTNQSARLKQAKLRPNGRRGGKVEWGRQNASIDGTS